MVTKVAGEVKGSSVKRAPRGMQIGFALLVLVGVVQLVQVTINLLSGNVSRLFSAVARDLAAKPNGTAAMPLAVAFVVVLVLVTFAWAELPVLFGWLAWRGRKWARVVLTVTVGIHLTNVTANAPYDFVLDGIQLAAVVLMWLPSSTAFISAESKRRTRGKRDPEADALADPGGKLPV